MVSMSRAALVTADLLAVTVLVFGLYFPRYRRRDMVVAILGLNVGVMAVATALSTAEVSAGSQRMVAPGPMIAVLNFVKMTGVVGGSVPLSRQWSI